MEVIWKSDLTDKIKRSFFRAAVVSILMYGCTIWMLTKRLKKELGGNYTRMLRAILNKSCRQHTTRHQLYGHLPPITKTIHVRRTRHAGEIGKKSLLEKSGRNHKGRTPVDPFTRTSKGGQLARTYIQQDVALKTYQKRWTIETGGGRGTVMSVLMAWHDDADQRKFHSLCAILADWAIFN